MYRPEIKVIDCSIRDGGLMNNSNFSVEMVKKVFRAVNNSGVDVIELGYRNSKDFFSTKEYGPWRFCDEHILREVTEGVDHQVEIAVMQDAHKAVPEDILPKSESVLDIIRIATYVKDVDKAIHLANNATEKGYKATINVMAISHALDRELDEALQQIEEETNVTACYLVDSFGALYSEDIHYLVHKFQKYIKTKEIGIHCHNNQQLAFANTIEGIIKGVNYLDGTLYGLGRAAGNCPLELLIGFLKNPKFDIRPLLRVIGSDILPLIKEMEWGYAIPYMITGILNLHPRGGMKQMNLPDDDEDKRNFEKFYELMATDDII
ncbi:MAG: aldolase catalytic domain-containing protein [Thermodesulfobacteriota bacterium]|nr:aldolase catalytic domain-containing protein [Thermodesulfobacteriota bacterium]